MSVSTPPSSADEPTDDAEADAAAPPSAASATATATFVRFPPSMGRPSAFQHWSYIGPWEDSARRSGPPFQGRDVCLVKYKSLLSRYPEAVTGSTMRARRARCQSTITT